MLPAATPQATFVATPIRWGNLGWAGAGLLAMAAVIASGNFWALNFLHVSAGLLWTGIDLFMGFVVGPALRAAPFEARREVMTRITPRTLFLMPTLAIITGTTGWYLAIQLGYLALPWPQFGWVAAALVVLAILTIQGLGYLLPTQLKAYYEMVKPEPDRERIGRLNAGYFYVIAMQGLMQVAIIAIMARFRAGL